MGSGECSRGVRGQGKGKAKATKATKVKATKVSAKARQQQNRKQSQQNSARSMLKSELKSTIKDIVELLENDTTLILPTYRFLPKGLLKTEGALTAAAAAIGQLPENNCTVEQISNKNLQALVLESDNGVVSEALLDEWRAEEKDIERHLFLFYTGANPAEEIHDRSKELFRAAWRWRAEELDRALVLEGGNKLDWIVTGAFEFQGNQLHHNVSGMAVDLPKSVTGCMESWVLLDDFSEFTCTLYNDDLEMSIPAKKSFAQKPWEKKVDMKKAAETWLKSNPYDVKINPSAGSGDRTKL